MSPSAYPPAERCANAVLSAWSYPGEFEVGATVEPGAYSLEPAPCGDESDQFILVRAHPNELYVVRICVS